MIFPKNKLSLSDHENIWTKFCFLDETGSLNNDSDPFFTVGLIKSSQPYYLYNKLQYERQKNNFHDEMKFNKASRRNIDFLETAMRSFFKTRSTHLYTYTIDKQGNYFAREYDNDQWVAYEQISLRLLDAAWGNQKNEILILLADHITCPKHVRYEVVVKRLFNEKNKRLALAGVCRLDSRANDLLQLVDLFIGAISYGLKYEYGIVSGDKHKIKLVELLKKELNISSFSDGFRNSIFNIFVDKDIKKRQNSNLKEKKPSS